MKIAVTGGTGFVGRHLAQSLVAQGHQAVIVARGMDRREEAIFQQSGITFRQADVFDKASLISAFTDCDAVAHCAGINREFGTQTYKRVHVDGTVAVVKACREAGVKKLALLSFLRARDGYSPYHTSKWEAEEVVKSSGLSYSILKAGVIYGKGDHMLDHLSHALYTFPIFGLVGADQAKLAPVAVADVVKILQAVLLSKPGDANFQLCDNKVFAVAGPEQLPLSEIVKRVGAEVNRRPILFPMPVFAHMMMASVLEWCMKIPLVSEAQVKILAEGVAEPTGAVDELPAELIPQTRFTAAVIKAGLPDPGPFSAADLKFACSS